MWGTQTNTLLIYTVQFKRKECLSLPCNHEIRLRQETLPIIGIQDFWSQRHRSFHRHHSLRPACTKNTNTRRASICIMLTEKHDCDKHPSLFQDLYLYTDTSSAPNAPTIRSAERHRESKGRRETVSFKECHRWDWFQGLQPSSSNADAAHVKCTHTLRLGCRPDNLISPWILFQAKIQKFVSFCVAHVREHPVLYPRAFPSPTC